MKLAVLVGCVLIASGMALAQQHDPKAHGSMASDATDSRELVTLPPAMTVHMLSNMRDHLLALQEIQAALSRTETDAAATIAEQRLGMTSLELHGAHQMASFMPQGMQDIGSQMHRSASRFAIAARDSGVTGDLRPALAALATISGNCVACHAGYRVR